MKKSLTLVAILAAVTFTAPSASFAENIGRTASGAIYGAVGTRVCGPACGVIGKEAGKRVFDGATWVKDKVGDAGANAGKKIREKVCSKRKC